MKLRIVIDSSDVFEAEGEPREIGWFLEWWARFRSSDSTTAADIGNLAEKLEKSTSQLADAVRANSGAV